MYRTPPEATLYFRSGYLAVRESGREIWLHPWPNLAVWVRSFGVTLGDPENADLPEKVWEEIQEILNSPGGFDEDYVPQSEGPRFLRGREAISRFFCRVPRTVLKYAANLPASRLQALRLASRAACCGWSGVHIGTWNNGNQNIRCLLFTRAAVKGGTHGAK